AQMKKTLKRSKLKTSIHQAGGSGDGTGSQPRVPDKPKVKSTDTNEGTGLIPGVPNVSQIVHSDSENESWGNSGDEANNQKTNDDEEETEDEFVHTPEDYVPTDDETNDETNDVDEEEYDRIDEELYGDVNIRLTDAEQDADEEGDAIIADTIQVRVEQTQDETNTLQDDIHQEAENAQAQVAALATINAAQAT
ncbi:hypothetical protein Tco_1131591, partial [Tanacetum coccineum]